MKREINENTKVTLTVGQLKRMVNEAVDPTGAGTRVPVLLRKAGFIHKKELDFTDDGNRFYGYELGDTGIIISYGKFDDGVYISSWDGADGSEYKAALDQLSYEQKKALPCSDAGERFNGGWNPSAITVDGLKQWAKDLIVYRDAVIDAAGGLETMSSEKADAINAQMKELVDSTIERTRKLLMANFDKLINALCKYPKPDYKVMEVFHGIRELKRLYRPIDVNDTSSWNRERLANPERTIRELKKSIKFYMEYFNEGIRAIQGIERK